MSSTTSRKRQATARDLALFASPERWPHRPFLPVARAIPGSQERELGILYDAVHVSGTYGYSATVFQANLLLLPKTEKEFLALPKHVYDTLDELAEDGWVVD